MRDIKFRAWDKQNNCWADIDLDDWANAVGPGAVLIGSTLFELRSDQQFEWQQYTGLKDKNDREVYEGDVVNTTIKSCPVMFVVWDEGTLSWGLVDPKSGHKAGDGYLDATMSYVEVIGNIYENPDMLN